jgi:hypothetical protein
MLPKNKTKFYNGKLTIITLEGNYVLPDQLDKFIGSSNNGYSFIKRLTDLRVTDKNHANRLIKEKLFLIPEFEAWWNSEGKFTRLTGRSRVYDSQTTTIKTVEGIFALPKDWRSLVGQKVLDSTQPLSERLFSLGLSRQAVLTIKRTLNSIPEFVEAFDPIRDKELTKIRSRILNAYNYSSDELREKAKEQGIEILSKGEISSSSQDLLCRCLINNTHGEFVSSFKGNSSILRSCPLCNTNSTVLERSIFQSLRAKGLFPITHFRLKSNKEIDILIPSLNLGIEVNGILTHNSSKVFISQFRRTRSPKPKPKNYHFNKTVEAESQGIEHIHIWEHEPLKSKGLAFLSNRLNNNHLNFDVENLPDLFKLRTDFYPIPPKFEGYSVYWKEEQLITDRNGKEPKPDDLVITFTAGLWIYTRNK